MYVVDTNVLIYAVHSGARPHAVARDWLSATLHTAAVVGLPWQTLLGFVRIVTNPRVFTKPMPTEDAFAAVQAWLAHPQVTTPTPTSRHVAILHGLLRESGTAGNLTSDAHLAALAIEHGGEVVSFDRDLARYGVRVLVPGATS